MGIFIGILFLISFIVLVVVTYNTFFKEPVIEYELDIYTKTMYLWYNGKIVAKSEEIEFTTTKEELLVIKNKLLEEAKPKVQQIKEFKKISKKL